MVKYSSIKYNDVANAPGISVSVFISGCDRRCKGCFNQETWDYNYGNEITDETIQSIVSHINENGIKRSLCILGGEPLTPHNRAMTNKIIDECLMAYPDLKIYVWTGYLFEDLLAENDKTIEDIFSKIYVLVDGPFVEELKDLRLNMRGSSNQRIFYFKE